MEFGFNCPSQLMFHAASCPPWISLDQSSQSGLAPCETLYSHTQNTGAEFHLLRTHLPCYTELRGGKPTSNTPYSRLCRQSVWDPGIQGCFFHFEFVMSCLMKFKQDK